MARAHITPAQSHPETSRSGLGACADAALELVHGSKKAAAIALQIDRSQLRRQLEIGTLMLRELDDPDVLAALGEMLLEQYGPARKTKKQLARERLPDMIASLLDLMEDDK